ncbi:hypothetical protein [Pseudarthrobacter sp. N5]|uniref:hypothetical protein n=1 Tax=Pseudarthrobacter sp. N5 TaxID=3418416 RepID=UPI003CE87B3C
MAKRLAGMTPLRKSPAFRRLWLGSAVSNEGSQLTLVVLAGRSQGRGHAGRWRH